MVIESFPPVETASPEGLLAIGGDLEVPSLKLAYENGIFPWPTEDFPLLWFAPPRRAVLDFKDLKISKRLGREIRNKDFHFKIDQNFDRVIRACAEGLTRQTSGTWITPEITEAFGKFHRAGFAHSFECYNSENQLVGGMYGVSIGQMFAGESMFYWESGASKGALLYACQFFQERGIKWIDVQMMSPFLEGFGAKEIPREEFMTRLKLALLAPPIFPLREKGSDVVRG